MSDTINDLYRCTPRETRAIIVDVIQAGLVPFVRSSPGMGKSALMASVCEEFDLELIDERLSTRSPVDLSGLPNFLGQDDAQRASFIPFDVYPIVGTKVPKNKNGWMLFLDEFNSAPKSVQAAAYKLVLDRKVGLHNLHPNVCLTAAGNLETDRAITNTISTAMQSRLIHIEMEISFQEWLEDVALKYNYDSRVVAFLSYMPGKLLDFVPSHQNRTFCCPRTWEFMNKLVKGKEIADKDIKKFAGTLTPGVAVEFVTFTKVFKNMPTIAQILSDPEQMFLPQDAPTRWAVITHLLEKVQSDTFAKVTKYVNRMPSEFRVLFFRGLLVRQPNLRSHPDFIRGLSELSRYIHGV